MNANQIIIDDFIDKHPFAAAQTLSRLNSDEVAALLQHFKLEKIIRLLGLMNRQKASDCLVLLPSKKIKELLEAGDIPFLSSLLKHIDEPQRTKILSMITSEKAASILDKLQYDPESVGAFMESVTIASKAMTVEEAIDIIRANESNKEFYLYVVQQDGHFEGIVRMKELLLAERGSTIGTLLVTSIPRFSPKISIKHILDVSEWNDHYNIPIVDKSGKLLGSLSYRIALKFNQKVDTSKSSDVLKTGSALGELYRIGLTGLLQSPGK